MIIGDHVIVCFHRTLDNQVYAAGVSVARDESASYVSWALVSQWWPMCPCQHLHPCGEGVVHTLVVSCWCSRIFTWHAILVSMVKFALNTYFVCLCLWRMHTTIMLMIIALPALAQGWGGGQCWWQGSYHMYWYWWVTIIVLPVLCDPVISYYQI